MDNAGIFFRFAHDLRSELRTVVTRVQLVEHSEASRLSEDDRALLEEAASAARSIGGLLTAMTAYVGGATEEGAENLRLMLRGVAIEHQGQVEIMNELADRVPVGLKFVLKELLTNAQRFRSPDRPLQVRIETRRVADALQIDVRDNGIGVEELYIEKIFQPFFTVHPRHAYPGYGLGLATCRRMIESWGGTISAKSMPGQDFTIYLSLPVEKALNLP